MLKKLILFTILITLTLPQQGYALRPMAKAVSPRREGLYGTGRIPKFRIKSMAYLACGKDVETVIENLLEFPNLDEIHLIDDTSGIPFGIIKPWFQMHLAPFASDMQPSDDYPTETNRHILMLQFETKLDAGENPRLVKIYFHMIDCISREKVGELENIADLTLINDAGDDKPLSELYNLEAYENIYRWTKEGKYILIKNAHLPQSQTLLGNLKTIVASLSFQKVPKTKEKAILSAA